MRILFRYVFREFCVPLAYCLAGFVSIYVLFELFGVFNRLLEARPGLWLCILYFAGYLSPYFKWLAPACLMLAALYTMWSFCRHSELIAMRSSGVGFLSIVRPMIVVAMLMAAFVGWVNESFVPKYAQWSRQMRSAKFNLDELVREDNIVYHNVGKSRTWNVGSAMNDEATMLEDVTISENWPDGGRRRTIKAARAEYLDGEWWLKGVTTFHFDSNGQEIASPVAALESLDMRMFPELNEQPLDFILQNRNPEFFSTRDRIRFLDTHPNMADKFRREMRCEMWSQIAAPLACIVITLFAIPAGVATGRQSVFKGIVAALSMFFAFYALTVGCMVLSRIGFMNAFAAAFLPDVVFLAIGVYLFYRQR